MSAITFDKLAYIDTLKAAGVNEEQARAQAAALDVALKDTVATKYDVEAVRHEVDLLSTELAPIKVELAMIKWMVGGTFFGIAMLVVRTFWTS